MDVLPSYNDYLKCTTKSKLSMVVLYKGSLGLLLLGQGLASLGGSRMIRPKADSAHHDGRFGPHPPSQMDDSAHLNKTKGCYVRCFGPLYASSGNLGMGDSSQPLCTGSCIYTARSKRDYLCFILCTMY